MSRIWENWTVDEVIDWLGDINPLIQEKYEELFRNEVVDGGMLKVLDETSLEEIGVAARLHRKRILLALEELSQGKYDESYNSRKRKREKDNTDDDGNEDGGGGSALALTTKEKTKFARDLIKSKSKSKISDLFDANQKFYGRKVDRSRRRKFAHVFRMWKRNEETFAEFCSESGIRIPSDFSIKNCFSVVGSTEEGSECDAGRKTAVAATKNTDETFFSIGPFATLESPRPLAMPSDKDWLTPYQCFVRQYFVEVFCATEADTVVALSLRGKQKPVVVGQVGMRCPYCHHNSDPIKKPQPRINDDMCSRTRARGSVYYPTTVATIYNLTITSLSRHLHQCKSVPQEVMSKYEALKAEDARSANSKNYWIQSALALGLVDTKMGIRLSASTPPPLPQLTDSQKNMKKLSKHKTNAAAKEKDGEQTDPSDTDEEEPVHLIAPEDKVYATEYLYHLLGQIKACVLTEADRMGKRKGLPPGFPGLACRHCFGAYGCGRFFPSTIKTLADTSKSIDILHSHLIQCRKCPTDVRKTLEQLRETHDEERAKMKMGSQKAFFTRIWHRLHVSEKALSGIKSTQSHGNNSGSTSKNDRVAVSESTKMPDTTELSVSESSEMPDSTEVLVSESTKIPDSTKRLEKAKDINNEKQKHPKDALDDSSTDL